MKANILYKCKMCGQVFINKSIDYEDRDFNTSSTLLGHIKTLPIITHDCIENIKSGVAEIIGVEKIQ